MIPYNPCWDIKDPSKLSEYYTCPRKYFYSHMLGWRSEVPSQDAYFGESWHKAREYMLLNGYDYIEGAFEAFMRYYREQYPEETDEMFRPKDPKGALLAIAKFAGTYQNDLLENKVHYTEISGTVPVDQKRVLHFRMDSVMEHIETGMIFSWDHKSTKRFSRQWEMQFFLSMQNGTYTHCLYCMYPIERVKGVEFCGTCFEYLSRGSKLRSAGYHASFKRVPAWKRPDQMNVWLWNVNNLLDDIERETDRLMDCSESDKVLMAFPLNPESCTKYFGCIFHDFCMTWENPLQHCFEPPLGFVQEFWDPREMETTNKMQLKWKE